MSALVKKYWIAKECLERIRKNKPLIWLTRYSQIQKSPHSLSAKIGSGNLTPFSLTVNPSEEWQGTT
jgi:hypothetical protein